MAFEITERSEYRQFLLTQNDTYPPVQVQLIENVGGCDTGVDLTGYQVNFFLRKAGEFTLINAGHTSCTIVDAVNGQIQYDWVVGDTANIGIHFGEFQIITNAGKKQTIRNALRFDIREEIDSVSGF